MLRLVALLVMPMLIVAQYSQTAEQVWTAFGSTPDVLLITWTSNTSEGGVRYRINGGNYSEPADYAIVENYALPPAYARGGLPLATYINYSIGSDALGWTADRTVLSHPGVGPNIPVTVGVLADMDYECFDGKVCYPEGVLAALLNPASLGGVKVNGGMFFCGDLAYANGNNTHWDGWQRFLDPLASKTPIMVAAGNHEYEDQGAIAFKTRFASMPFLDPVNEATGPLFYSYNTGPLHVILMSAYSDAPTPSSPQTVFIKNDLASVDRTVTPWVFVVCHPPLYNSNTKHQGSGDQLLAAYEPLFLEYRVNAAVYGHVHAYQRTKMVYNGTPVDESTGKGLYHFLVGNSGKELYQTWMPDNYTWLAERDAEFWGPSFFTFPNATHAHFTIHCVKRYNGTDYLDCDPSRPYYESWLINQLYTNPFMSPTPTVVPSAAAAGSSKDNTGPLTAGLIFVSVVCGVLALGLAAAVFGKRLLCLPDSDKTLSGRETERLV